MTYSLRALPGLIALIVLLGGCDAGFTGEPLPNQPPETYLSVRDSSLVDNLSDEERLVSTVYVSWTGDDPDGYVAAYEFRYYDAATGPADVFWTRTIRNDSLVLLPIPPGSATANVVFEVRAIDNEGLADPTPARTVFPIRNSPPEIRLVSFELPPDTTFPIFSFSWQAEDPDGAVNLARIEVSFNDSTRFVALPPDVDFVTFVANFDRDDPTQTEVTAHVYTGRAFRSTTIEVPGLRLDAENTFYVRAVDQADTSSALARHTWFVKKPRSRVLLVNDYRKATGSVVMAYHRAILRDFLPPGMPIDEWDISRPYVTGSAGNTPRSDALPPVPDPTLRQTLALWDYIYWVSTATVNSVVGNNLPYAAAVMDLFFERGGRILVHSPVTQPRDPEANLGNPAILMLPLSDLLVLPDSVRRLELATGAALTPVNAPPGVVEALPALQSNRFFINELPYFAEGATIIPLYEADYQYLSRSGRRGAWPYPRTVASISADARVALFGLPLVNELSGEPELVGADGDPEAGRRAVMFLLRSLGFPER
ncbi:hypothetical protein Rhom172_0314 [Rhodothermus marinus SG0.5JP17-172]|uniref:hypothetical protein n=1 Tax=Rhodothermus marinus TaxID=29549 RepID=UPI000223D6B5|nr:hypothetical protein [Rhodothermus marinus]AEN72262.1 hypothetical protein Rhom172_0314 [Rhodothermus marinus SG0.5JP17-172]MBO2491786.1 hypothetical protein [Rhodothermus marinus]